MQGGQISGGPKILKHLMSGVGISGGEFSDISSASFIQSNYYYRNKFVKVLDVYCIALFVIFLFFFVHFHIN